MHFVDCPEWCGDEVMDIQEIEKLIAKLKEKYGEDAVIKFDAGPYNVSVMIKSKLVGA